ncbi:MAG: RecQ family ATP-dependent DNA helicase [Chitinophagales bacterium]|nr:RecQ family ATP-dependent DNA helicase [Chitinophagales bacterium]
MRSALEILRDYWGYKEFRPLQADIIESVNHQQDTIALLPTGGGKSICYQVPGLMTDGICIVISPLIALMNDQVNNLTKRNVKALAIHSALSRYEIDILLDHCVYGNVKFLYISPERLKTELFRQRLSKMKVNLLAVDEAHCISEWGYDFRPSYLEISSAREILPDTPILALTASATPEVVNDISSKLKLSRPQVFRKSFKRENLSYVVYKDEGKNQKLIHILTSVNGSTIIYVRSRNKAREYSELLRGSRVNATYYHAGLSHEERSDRQHRWMDGSIRVMVCTNAFGMGIDKPDVRLVIHIDLPESPEAYYQEAGRAGRDEKRSYAVVLFDNNDIVQLRKRMEYKYPKKDMIASVYEAIGNYLRIAIGSGAESTHNFDLADFLFQYNLHPQKTFNSIKILEQLGLIQLIDSSYIPARLKFKADRNEIYKFQVENRKFEQIIQYLLRTYSGVMDDFVPIDEAQIARKLEIDRSIVLSLLNKLKELDYLFYEARSGINRIYFIRSRVPQKEVFFDSKEFDRKFEIDQTKMEAVIKYATNETDCRNIFITTYFGEKEVTPCGICDICINKRKLVENKGGKVLLVSEIEEFLKTEAKTVEDILYHFSNKNEKEVFAALRWMMDESVLKKTPENTFVLNS